MRAEIDLLGSCGRSPHTNPLSEYNRIRNVLDGGAAQEGRMGTIDWRRVVLCGLLTGVVRGVLYASVVGAWLYKE